nr:chromosome segregation protein SMC [Armatimonadota bacterium]
MQLKRLEVHGFKTFANATALEFSPGITAIVGPNGSGKSNVSDAVIWGLGESNIRALRGGKLQDVIFAGSSSRRPTGLAEVTLTFDNSSRSLPLDYAEVSVTRRVYRSLESEYFINRTPCRLRDIVDLFLDTGIGRESYFALNQGEIDMVLSANPDERRLLFEEAAGIKKYRVRKRESLRKLESTQANLLRIFDLIGEVEARVGPLERQAEGAKKYRELAAKLREAELGAFAASWRDLLVRSKVNRDELDAVRSRAATADAELARLNADEENTRLLLHKSGEELEAAHRHHEEISAERARLQGVVEVLRERIKADTAAGERARIRLSEIVLQKDEIEKSLNGGQDELRSVEGALRETSAQLALLRQKLASAETHLKTCTTALERAQAQAVERAGRVAKLEADRDASARRLQSLHGQVAALQERLRLVEERRSALRLREAEIERTQNDLNFQIEAAMKEAGTIEAGLAQSNAQAVAQSEDIRTRERDIAGQTSRLRLLEELQDQREGFYKGVKTLLQAAAAGQLDGHYRPVADIVTVKREYEAAIEAALGGSVQDIITETDEEARAGIRFLKRTNAGRATFLSLDLVSRLSRGGQRPSGKSAGVIGTAIDIVDFDVVYQPVLEMLLGRVIVCDTLENGNAAAHRLSHWSRMVTLEGEVISSQGAMIGGSRQVSRASIVGRTGQIQELRTTIQKARKELDGVSLRRGELQVKIADMRQQQVSAEKKAQTLRTVQAQHRRDRDHLATDTHRMNGEEANLRKEIERAVGQHQAEEKTSERLAAQSLESHNGSPGH